MINTIKGEPTPPERIGECLYRQYAPVEFDEVFKLAKKHIQGRINPFHIANLSIQLRENLINPDLPYVIIDDERAYMKERSQIISHQVALTKGLPSLLDFFSSSDLADLEALLSQSGTSLDQLKRGLDVLGWYRLEAEEALVGLEKAIDSGVGSGRRASGRSVFIKRLGVATSTIPVKRQQAILISQILKVLGTEISERAVEQILRNEAIKSR